MKRYITNCLIALNLIALANTALAQKTVENVLSDKLKSAESKILVADSLPKRPLETALNPFVDKNEIAGAVVLVADKQGVVAVQSVGLADISAKQAMSRDTIFWIA